MASPAGPVMLVFEGCVGAPRLEKFDWPITAVAVAEGAVGPRGAENFKTRELLKSETKRFRWASKARPAGVSNPDAVTVPPVSRLAPLAKKPAWPITVSAEGGVA